MKKVFLRSIHLLLLTSFVFGFAACQQRPNRPSPDQTMSGMGPGDSLPFDAIGGAGAGGGTFVDSDDLFFDGGSGLEARSDDELYGEQVRGVLEPIFFEFDRSALGQTERNKAMAAADHLRSNPRDQLLIEGHCDWRGTTEYNLGLGDRRATSVKDYLVSLGIDSGRIKVLSKGDLEAVQGGSADEMAHDRRAELVILKN